MNIPTLPTDNLYKFLFFAGLAILLFTFTVPSNKLNELATETIKIKGNQEKLLLKYDYYYQEYNDMLQEFNKIKDSTNKAFDNSTEISNDFTNKLAEYYKEMKSLADYRNRYLAMKKSDSIIKAVSKLIINNENQQAPYIDKAKKLREQTNNYEDRLNPLINKGLELELQRIEIVTQVALLEYKAKDQNSNNIILFSSFVIGFLLVFAGFFKWLEYQRYSDAVLYSEYLKILKSNKDSNIEPKNNTIENTKKNHWYNFKFPSKK